MICDYGCDQEAKYQFKNGKWCCGKNINSCSKIKEKQKKHNGKGKGREPWNKGKKDCFSKETIENFKKNRSGKNNPMFGKKHSKESIEKIIKNRENFNEKIKQSYTDELKEIRRKKALELWEDKTFRRKNIKAIRDSWKKQEVINKHKRSIEQIKELYPFFSQVEEMKYNPEKLKEIQVRCKNHNCPNSKEQNGWFTPTGRQLEGRISALENKGSDLNYFYCCDECKKTCPLFKSKGGNHFKTTEKIYTYQEYQQFREYVLERDNYECQYCGEKAEHVHHERPQKIEPFYSLDPDLAWSVCSKCHYEKGHKNDCSTGHLSSIIC